MASRGAIMRDAVVLGLGISGIILVLLAGALWVVGTFSFSWFAHALLVVAVAVAGLEMFVLIRAFGTMQLRLSGTVIRRLDNTQGCGIALLLGIVVLALFACAGALNWVAGR